MKIQVKGVNEKNYNLYVESNNSKLGNISNFSIKKGVEAYCSRDCNKCYCNKMKMYSPHVNNVNSNFNAIDDSENDLILYFNIVEAISNYIKLNGCNTFRFNVEGDISNNYLSIIIDIAINTPECEVYLYTKNYSIIENNIDKITNISNLTILISIMNFNDSNIIEKFRIYNNIKFFITTRNRQEIMTYFKTYNMSYFDTCKNDINKEYKCQGCKLCYDHESKFIFNQYRGIKKVDNTVINEPFLLLNTVNRFTKNKFLNTALLEALTCIITHTTATKKELLNLDKLADIKIRSFSKNAKKQYGQCKKVNKCYKITINNMNYYKTVCVLIHELLHVLVFEYGHEGKFKKYVNEIEENTIYKVVGGLNDINYNRCLDLENEVKELSQYFVKTRILTEFSYYDFCKTTKNELITISTNYYCEGKSNDSYYNYVNYRSISMKYIREYINKIYIDIAKNNN